jgi:hypothetical protein
LYGEHVVQPGTHDTMQVCMSGHVGFLDSLQPEILQRIRHTAQLSGAWQHHLRPVLDAFWNAFGVSRCPDFLDDGRWAPI